MNARPYTDEDVQDALDLAKPGRLLPLDSEGNLSAAGVTVVLHNLCALASAYQTSQAFLRARGDEIARRITDCCDNTDAKLKNRAESAEASLREALEILRLNKRCEQFDCPHLPEELCKCGNLSSEMISEFVRRRDTFLEVKK